MNRRAPFLSLRDRSKVFSFFHLSNTCSSSLGKFKSISCNLSLFPRIFNLELHALGGFDAEEKQAVLEKLGCGCRKAEAKFNRLRGFSLEHRMGIVEKVVFLGEAKRKVRDGVRGKLFCGLLHNLGKLLDVPQNIHLLFRNLDYVKVFG